MRFDLRLQELEMSFDLAFFAFTLDQFPLLDSHFDPLKQQGNNGADEAKEQPDQQCFP